MLMTTEIADASRYPCHFADQALIRAPSADLVAYLDKHSQLSAHMRRRSWMMGGGRMDISTDEGGFQRIGSRLRLAGRAFGFALFLEEEITQYRPPLTKVWEIIGTPRLLIIGRYRTGFDIIPEAEGSLLRIFLDYELASGALSRPTGRWLAPMYAEGACTT